MPRQLLIMRHAKSAWDTNAPSDFERPLAKRGLRDAPRMGSWLKKQKLTPDLVISSPAERAKQTAQIVSKAMGLKKKRIQWDSRVYGAGTEDLLEILAELAKKNKSVILIGHNPGLEFLYAYLVGPEGMMGIDAGLIKTATVVQLEMPEDWNDLKSGSAKLITVQNPGDLPS
ncbi:MAG: phosphohistidine phosphatase SixA [Magnetococcales bacterium]|nr:phosphohistidine phosphatase SixA [Magnetococcales bacterium]